MLTINSNSGNADIQFKFRVCLLTFSSNSGNAC